MRDRITTNAGPFPAGANSRWTQWLLWTPRMAGLDFDSASFVEVNYGESGTTKQYGRYRTNGDEVEAQATIVFGANPDDDGPLNIYSDYIIYLSLPLPVDVPDIDPPIDLGPDSSVPINDWLYSYNYGYTPMTALLGACAMSAGSFNDSQTTGQLILPPWSQGVTQSFPDGTPPVDINYWVSACTPDFYNGQNLWTWYGGGFYGGVSPYTLSAMSGPVEGLMVTWTLRYFTA